MKIAKHLLSSAAVAGLMLAASSSLAKEVELIRVATMPAGAEVTGLSTNAKGELFLNAQHPGGKNVLKGDASPAIVGYVHGFDHKAISGPGMSIPDASKHNEVNVANGTYISFGKAGDKLGSGQVLGGVYDTSGKLMFVSNTPDFNGFIPRGDDKAYLYTAWEGGGREGASSISKVALNRVDGKWQADLAGSKMLDLSSVGGGNVLCSGVVTPWGTPLAAEEYFFYNTAVWNHPDNHDEDERASFQKGNDINYIKPKSMAKYMGKMPNPYRYGYMIEINNAATEASEEESGRRDQTLS